MKSKPSLLLVSASVFAACGEAAPPESPTVSQPVALLRTPPPEPKPAPDKATEPREAAGEASALKEVLLGLNPAPEPVREASPKAARRRIRRRQRRAKEKAGDAAFEAFAAGALKTVGLSDSEFQDTIGRWKGLSRCLVESAGRMPDRTGALEVAFSILPDGSVARCDVVRARSRAAQAIASCVTRKARRMRFPSFSGSQATERTAKFVF